MSVVRDALQQAIELGNEDEKLRGYDKWQRIVTNSAFVSAFALALDDKVRKRKRDDADRNEVR
jgi:hypothetical protein